MCRYRGNRAVGGCHSCILCAGSAAATVGGVGAARQRFQVAHLLWHADHDALEIPNMGPVPVDMSVRSPQVFRMQKQCLITASLHHVCNDNEALLLSSDRYCSIGAYQTLACSHCMLLGKHYFGSCSEKHSTIQAA